MSFDIHQAVFNKYGEYDEERATRYQEELLNLFATSPEGQEVRGQGDYGAWAAPFLTYAISYLGVLPPDMTPAQVQEVVLDLIPRKVAVEPGCGHQIVRELRTFWSFLKREFGLANTDGIVRLLNDALATRIDRALANPANFGMAKSFVMMGKAAGFDTTSEDGMQQWVAAYNTGLPGRIAPAVPPDAAAPWPALPALAGGRLPHDAPAHGPAGHRSKSEAARRKMAKDSRRKNRRKT